MNFEFNDEEKAFAESFRNFCKKEIEPYSVEYEENGEIPRSQFKKLAEAGFTDYSTKNPTVGVMLVMCKL
jgi:alkylation response protein AidB-like acyl-CoA dehydrogenase